MGTGGYERARAGTAAHGGYGWERAGTGGNSTAAHGWKACTDSRQQAPERQRRRRRLPPRRSRGRRDADSTNILGGQPRPRSAGTPAALVESVPSCSDSVLCWGVLAGASLPATTPHPLVSWRAPLSRFLPPLPLPLSLLFRSAFLNCSPDSFLSLNPNPPLLFCAPLVSPSFFAAPVVLFTPPHSPPQQL